MQNFQLLKHLAKFTAKNTAKNVILFTLVFLLTISPSTFAKEPENSPAKIHTTQAQANTQTTKASANQTQQLLQQGEKLYQEGDFPEAINVLQKAVSIYKQENNNLGQAAALTNLSLVYQRFGTQKQANEAVSNSLKLLGWDSSSQKLNIKHPNPELQEILAQTLDIQAGLLLTEGKPNESLQVSEQTEKIWNELKNNTGAMRSRINQAQALRVSGFYRRSRGILEEIEKQLKEPQLDPLVKVTALRALGNTRQQLGDLEQSEEALNKSLKIAEDLKLSQEIALTEFSLGNTARSRTNTEDAITKAINHYKKAAEFTSNPLTKVQAQINQLNLRVKKEEEEEQENEQKEEQKITEAKNLLITEGKTLIPTIQSQLAGLPTNQAGIYARINFARTLNTIDNKPDIAQTLGTNVKDITQILTTSLQQAKAMGDQRAESYALGSLGEVYENKNRWKEAQDLTEQALFLAQKNNDLDVAYIWEWQLGRLLKAQNDIPRAISAYDSAVATLDSLRTDLAVTNREMQFNFRERVEPIYRESVKLLLQEKGKEKPDLDKVRKRMEALQVAELDNYFREACLSNEFVVIDEVVDKDNPDTAIFYPIILDNQLEIILKLPGKELIRKTSVVKNTEVEEIIRQMRNNIVEPDRIDEFTKYSQQLYQLLIKPIEAELKNSKEKVKTIVFIPDGSLRNIPMAALYDGKEYLAQKYAIAISPGLQLFIPKSLTRQQLNVLAGGLSEIPKNEEKNFAPLPNVGEELTSIKESGLPTVKLYNNTFTSKILQDKINDQPFQIVHLATHGRFSSRANDTFILASDKRINVGELDDLLRSREERRTEPIELLVLSACETATGDERAALGLAGVALRAGARSTLASLWQIGDDSTAYFIDQFYRQLITDKTITTAEALRASQVKLMNTPGYKSPMFWAPYVLVGNWL